MHHLDSVHVNMRAFHDVVLVLALFMASFTAVLLRERIPTHWHQLRAMTFVDHFLLFNHVATWIFNILCAMLTGASFFTNYCLFSSYMCLFIIGIQKSVAMFLMLEKLYHISSQTSHLPRLKDKEYIIHSGVALSAVVSILVWLMITFGSKQEGKICYITWHRDSFLFALSLVILLNAYFTFRCTYILFRTKNALTRSWAFKYLWGIGIHVSCSTINLGYMALSKEHMVLFVCLTVCLLDANITAASMHYLVHSNPAYKAMDEVSPLDVIRRSSEIDMEMQEDAQSRIAKSVAPTYRTRATTVSLRRSNFRWDSKSRVSCSLVSGATPEGIAEYLSQVNQVSVASPYLRSPQVPRLVGLLPSHPEFKEHMGPKPNYSCFPSYSTEDLTLYEGSSAAGSIPAQSPCCSSASIGKRRESAMSDKDKIRAELYACEELAHESEQEEEMDQDSEAGSSSNSRNMRVTFHR